MTAPATRTCAHCRRVVPESVAHMCPVLAKVRLERARADRLFGLRR